MAVDQLSNFVTEQFCVVKRLDGGDSSSSSTTPASSTSTTTDTTQTSANTVDETPVYEGFKYLNTAKGVDPRQQEAALLKIKEIDTAECDGYECDFTFSGRKAVFVYPPETPTGTSSLNTFSVNQNLDATVVFTKKFASQNSLSALADTPICPAQTQKKALVLFASIGTFPNDIKDEHGKLMDDYLTEAADDISNLLKIIGYKEVDIRKGAEANHNAFDDIKTEDYGTVIISTHGSKNGYLLTNDLIDFGVFSYKYPDDVKKHINEKGDDIYVRFGLHGMPDNKTFIGITSNWWEDRNIAKVHNSEGRVYLISACSAFADGSNLSEYFTTNMMNGIGFKYDVNVNRANLFVKHVLGESASYVKSLPFQSLKNSIELTTRDDFFINNPVCHPEGVTAEKIEDYTIFARDCARLITPDSRNLYLSPSACNSTTPANTPPSVSISKPFTNSKFSVGTSVVFEGTATD